jgi:hypothetical protein
MPVIPATGKQRQENHSLRPVQAKNQEDCIAANTLGLVVQVCNPSVQEAQAGGSLSGAILTSGGNGIIYLRATEPGSR